MEAENLEEAELGLKEEEAAKKTAEEEEEEVPTLGEEAEEAAT